MKRWSKKGVSHVEVILSFVIFIGFTIFLIAILNPIKRAEKSGGSVDVVEEAVKDFSEISLKFFTISLSSSVDEISDMNCFFFDYDMNNVIAKNKAGGIIDAGSEGGNVYIQKTNRFYSVYSCADFTAQGALSGCKNLISSDYSLGLLRNYKMTSNKKLQELKRSYEADEAGYQGTKKTLNIPTSYDFGIIIKDTVGTEKLKMIKDKPDTAIVKAKEFPIQLVYSDGRIEYLMMNVQTW